MLSRFHPIPERYGQTDGRTDRRTEFQYQYENLYSPHNIARQYKNSTYLAFRGRS